MLSFNKKVYFISLIPTNSWWMNLLKKPFFTSVLLIQIIIVIATTNKICTIGRSVNSQEKTISTLFQHITLQIIGYSVRFQLLPSLIPNICFSDIHFQGSSIRLVSCYTFISGFRLPWPPTNCPNWRTPFVVSLINSVIVCQFNLIFGSSQIAIPAYQAWPTRENNIFVDCVNTALRFTTKPTHLKFENKFRMLHSKWKIVVRVWDKPTARRNTLF